MAEIYRSAIQAIDPGQREAARSLGLGGHRHIVTLSFHRPGGLPLPSLVNQFTDIIKDSSGRGPDRRARPHVPDHER